MDEAIEVVTEKEMPWMMAQGWLIVADKSQTNDGNYRMKKGAEGSTVINRTVNGDFAMPAI